MSREKEFEKEHLVNLERYKRKIEAIYNEAAKQAGIIGASVLDFNSDKPFSFSQYPSLKARIDRLVADFYKSTYTSIINGIEAEWTLANNKNSELARSVFGSKLNGISKELERKYFSNNLDALRAFKARKTNGLDLSQRVWKYTGQFKQEMEMTIDLGLRSGQSANEMARSLQEHLHDPNKLFRRVRDEHGNLHLSKRAKSYNPGQGVYRSSFKNARRLAATETNIAYRTSDHERIKQFDFVLGIEIKLSNNHTLNGEPFTDICDELAGMYPKEFKFTGWHPLCRCHSETILADEDEFLSHISEGEGAPIKGQIKSTPRSFNKWVKDNKERIDRAKSLPYFLRDNKKFLKAQRPKPVMPSNLLKNNVSVTNHQVKKILHTYAEENPSLFNGHLKKVSILKNMRGMMHNARSYSRSTGKYVFSEGNTLALRDASYRINGTIFNPAKDVKDAMEAIRTSKALSFNQEYALESLWHEIRHSGAKGWGNIRARSEVKTVAMEVINQFCARHSYDTFIKQLGGKSRHKKAVIEEGYGYSQYLDNFRGALKHYKIDEKKAFEHFYDLIQETPYEDVLDQVVIFFEKHEVKEARQVVMRLRLSRKDFTRALTGDK